MEPTHFSLVTEWRLDAPVERVWALIEATEAWPGWWRAVKGAWIVRVGAKDGVGAVHRLAWSTALPYALTFDVETVRVEPLRELEGRAFGELDGTGIWTFTPEGDATRVRYLWRVEVTKPWMRLLAPLLRPVFKWNHNKVMAWGLEGARRQLAEG